MSLDVKIPQRKVIPHKEDYIFRSIHLFSIKTFELSLWILLPGIILLIPTKKPNAQNINSLTPKLHENGLCEIRTVKTDSFLYASFSNREYRWDVAALQKAIDIIHRTYPTKNLNLLLCHQGISVLETKLIPDTAFTGAKHKVNNSYKLIIEKPREATIQLLQTSQTKYQDKARFQLIIYPELYLKNTNMNRIYEIQANVAPALHSDLWRGFRFTAQIVFPLYSDPLYYKEKGIRPGFLTISQRFRLRNNYNFCITLGNFNMHRYGADIEMHKDIFEQKGSIHFRAGLTGKSQFYEGEWYRNQINTLT